VCCWCVIFGGFFVFFWGWGVLGGVWGSGCGFIGCEGVVLGLLGGGGGSGVGVRFADMWVDGVGWIEWGGLL